MIGSYTIWVIKGGMCKVQVLGTIMFDNRKSIEYLRTDLDAHCKTERLTTFTLARVLSLRGRSSVFFHCKISFSKTFNSAPYLVTTGNTMPTSELIIPTKWLSRHDDWLMVCKKCLLQTVGVPRRPRHDAN